MYRCPPCSSIRCNLPLSQPTLKWCGVTLLVMSATLTLFAIFGYLAANQLLPGALNAGSIGNALLAAASGSTLGLGILFLGLKRHKVSEVDSDSTSAQQLSPTSTRNQSTKRKNIPSIFSDSKDTGITGRVAIRNLQLKGSFGVVGSPQEGLSFEEFCQDLTYVMKGNIERVDLQEWRNEPDTVLVQCLVSTPSSTEEFWLPLFLFIHDDHYDQPKENGDQVEFSRDGQKYSLQIAQENPSQRRDYPEMDFKTVYHSLTNGQKRYGMPVLTPARLSGDKFELQGHREVVDPIQKAIRERKHRKDQERCNRYPELKKLGIEKPTMPRCLGIHRKDNRIVMGFNVSLFGEHDLSMHSLNNGFAIYVKSKTPLEDDTEYVILFTSPEEFESNNVKVVIEAGVLKITIEAPLERCDDWHNHFKGEINSQKLAEPLNDSRPSMKVRKKASKKIDRHGEKKAAILPRPLSFTVFKDRILMRFSVSTLSEPKVKKLDNGFEVHLKREEGGPKYVVPFISPEGFSSDKIKLSMIMNLGITIQTEPEYHEAWCAHFKQQYESLLPSEG